MNWKDAPKDPQKMWLNRSLELQINLFCNWHCTACDAGSQFGGFDFIRKATMTLEQISYFMLEMRRHNAYLGRIRILGGEPTVHPKFAAIVGMLSDLVPEHIGRLEVVTNGSHMERIKELRPLIGKVRVSGEEAKQSAHVANLIHTPASLGYEGKMCNAPWHCGMSLNYFGYFPCSSGAGIARFTDDMLPWQRMSLPLTKTPMGAVDENWPELQNLCNHCYHGLREADKVRCGTSDPSRNAPGAHIKEKIDAWRGGKKAEWKVYGA